MTHDLRLHSGERQVAARYGEIRADHRFRYEWAHALIPADTVGLDCFCGNGYGTWRLGETRQVRGIDGSSEAIEFAKANYARPGVAFQVGYWPFPVAAEPIADFVVSLESIEHVADGSGFFDAMVASLRPGGILIFSTPNEDLLPHAGMGNHFHHRHYTMHQAQRLALDRGLSIEVAAGQDVYRMEGRRPVGLVDPPQMRLKQSQPGQFMILACRKPS